MSFVTFITQVFLTLTAGLWGHCLVSNNDNLHNTFFRLMEKCQKITSKMESLVEALITDSQAASDLTEQPKIITEGFKLTEYQMIG